MADTAAAAHAPPQLPVSSGINAHIPTLTAACSPLQVPASTSGEMWIRAVWQELLETVLVLQRLLWIFLLFLPVAASAPLALSLDFKRAEWMELLRKSLEAAGGWRAGAAARMLHHVCCWHCKCALMVL
jgi:hypothetical protein